MPKTTQTIDQIRGLRKELDEILATPNLRLYPNAASGTDIDSLVTPGIYPFVGSAAYTTAISATSTPPFPVSASLVMEVLALGLGRVQRITTTGSPQVVYQRNFDQGSWQPWRRIDRPAPQLARMALTCSQGTTYTAAPYASYHLRQIIRTGADVDEWRLSIRNFEQMSSTAGTAAVTITYVGVGVARRADGTLELDGQISGAITPVLTTPTPIPTDGTALVTPWSRYQLKGGQEYILTIGYTSAATGTIYRGRGYLWGNTTHTDAAKAISGSNIYPINLVPFLQSIEARTTARRVAMIGDSQSAANNADHPVSESPLHLWAQQARALPVLMAHPGSRLVHWTDGTQDKWTSQLGADDVILWLGYNDIWGGTDTLDQLKSATISCIANARRLSTSVYAMTVLPRGGTVDLPERDALRRQYNDWLATLPAGLAGCFDAAGAVEGLGGVIDPRWVSDDNIHLNKAGVARVANSITLTGGQ